MNKKMKIDYQLSLIKGISKGCIPGEIKMIPEDTVRKEIPNMEQVLPYINL